MKKYLIILLYPFLFTSSYATDFSSLERAEASCNAIHSDPTDMRLWRCLADAHRVFRESTRLNSMKSYANNKAFVLEQMGYLTQDALSGKISNEEYKLKGRHLLQVNDELFRDAKQALRRELKDITDQMAAQQSSLFLKE